jgi:hypothetical protein
MNYAMNDHKDCKVLYNPKYKCSELKREITNRRPCFVLLQVRSLGVCWVEDYSHTTT